MKVSNIRFGFATNSSSTHSIVFRKDLPNARDSYTPGEFGWEKFTLKSSKAKSCYLGVLLYSTLEREIGGELASLVTKDLLGEPLPNDSYIDHKSFMALPESIDTRKTSIQFFNELLEYYLREDIIIIGGNDNDDDWHADIRHPHILPVEVTNDFVCRKDGDWWLLHSKKTGTKIRLSFNDNAKPYSKATSPELVDLKITNQCIINCEYCYQDSTLNGKHADMDNLRKIVWSLETAKVLEVALGGGEPTRHPRFTEILEMLYDNRILVNFTTRDLSWCTDTKIVEAVDKYVSRFGVSINTQYNLQEALKTIPQSIQNKVYFHYVIGTGCLKDILSNEALLSYNGGAHPIILLGFKRTGRGLDYKRWGMGDDKNWAKMVKNGNATVGIDTALANEYKGEVQKEFVQSLVQYEEGKFSMYIDAVEMKIAKCSYSSEFTSIENADCANDINLLEEFAKY